MTSPAEVISVSPQSKAVVVWRVLDGKPGHENQTLGLTTALARLMPVVVHDVPALNGLGAWLRLIRGRCPQTSALPAPDLIVGAGHATHVDMLACRRARGGRVVVLMRPSLPRSWFDLCVIPAHDGIAPSERVLVTRGVLNPLRASATKRQGIGLILVGGPSAHFGWDQAGLCAQVETIAAQDPRHWTVATSRRTPKATVKALQSLSGDNLSIVPSASTAPGWLATQLALAPMAWVTEDSVSMLYEVLSAGAACGVLPVPRYRAGRVSKGVDMLLSEGVVQAYTAWRNGQALTPLDDSFNEAERVARWIRQRWFAR